MWGNVTMGRELKNKRLEQVKNMSDEEFLEYYKKGRISSSLGSLLGLLIIIAGVVGIILTL